jgi:hypothetical protein
MVCLYIGPTYICVCVCVCVCKTGQVMTHIRLKSHKHMTAVNRGRHRFDEGLVRLLLGCFVKICAKRGCHHFVWFGQFAYTRCVTHPLRM